MNYSDQRLLLEYARLQLQIVTAKLGPATTYEVTPANVHRSEGYKKLRAFYMQLGPNKRATFRGFLRRQIDGAKQVMELARQTGEPLSMADIEFDLLDEAGAPMVPPELHASDGQATPDAATVHAPTKNEETP